MVLTDLLTREERTRQVFLEVDRALVLPEWVVERGVGGQIRAESASGGCRGFHGTGGGLPVNLPIGDRSGVQRGDRPLNDLLGDLILQGTGCSTRSPADLHKGAGTRTEHKTHTRARKSTLNRHRVT